MKYRFRLLVLLVFIIAGCKGMKSKENEFYSPSQITPSGDLANRIELTERRLQCEHPFTVDFVVQDVARVKDLERRFEEYEGDVSGRILGAWSYAARLLNQRPTKLDSIANRVLHHQNPDGSFGKNQQAVDWDMWGRQLWGHGRLLVGLFEYFKLTGDIRFLHSAENLGDYLAATVSNWTTEHRSHHWFTNYTSLLESLMILYEISRKHEYLTAAEKMVPFIPEFAYYHSHGYLISLVGLAKLYQNTGFQTYWNLLYDTYWRDLIRYAHRPDGGICEWFPLDDRTEGCSIVDWLRLNLCIWEITKDAVYIEEAEKTWLNALNFHQTHNGAFGHARLNSRGYKSPYSEAWWCCLMHGLFGQAEILQHSLVAEHDKVWLNFYTPLEAQFSFPDSPITIRSQTNYPNDGQVEITIETEAPQSFAFYVLVSEFQSCRSKKIKPQISQIKICVICEICGRFSLINDLRINCTAL